MYKAATLTAHSGLMSLSSKIPEEKKYGTLPS